MLRLIGAELFKLRKRKITWILLAVLIGVIILINFLLLAIAEVNFPSEPHGRMQNLLGLPVTFPLTLSILSSFGSVLAVVFLASSMGSEFNWRTIRVAVVSSESRFKLLGAKLISAAIFILIGMVLGLVTGLFISIVTTFIGGYKFDFSFASNSYLWEQFLQFWRTFYILIPYMLLGFMFSIVGRSAMPGISLGIGIIFLESVLTAFMTLAGGWIANIPDYLIAANVRTINSLSALPQNFQTGPGFGGMSVDLPNVLHATITLAIYSGVFLVIAFYTFGKRDVTG
jgi:ABC-2 type transport system permease protein|tara:strand:- start:1321 stop:2175 length:855 start_codon:yes stop_codon:yes gene_type:complete